MDPFPSRMVWGMWSSFSSSSSSFPFPVLPFSLFLFFPHFFSSFELVREKEGYWWRKTRGEMKKKKQKRIIRKGKRSSSNSSSRITVLCICAWIRQQYKEMKVWIPPTNEYFEGSILSSRNTHTAHEGRIEWQQYAVVDPLHAVLPMNSSLLVFSSLPRNAPPWKSPFFFFFILYWEKQILASFSSAFFLVFHLFHLLFILILFLSS